MNLISRWLERRQLDRELADEMQAHIEERIDQLREQGQSEAEARINARRRFGNLTRQKEKSRTNWGWDGAEQLVRDVRFSLRLLRGSPIFTTAAILTLALGIGANTAIFSLIDNLLLRPLPIAEPDRLVQVIIAGQQPEAIFGYSTLPPIAQRSQTLAGLFTWNQADLSLGSGADARPVAGAVASGAIYRTLGIQAQAGRLFGPADDAPGAPAVAVISDRFWQSEFRREPQTIGRKLTLDRHVFTIVGVTPAKFLGLFAGAAPSITIPIHANADLHPQSDLLHTTRMSWLSIFGRLKPGVTMQQAQAELKVLSPSILKVIDFGNAPPEFFRQSFSVRRGAAGIGWQAEHLAKPAFVLIGISGLVLLIACVNLANLMLARAAARERELSVRLALGAGRARLIRQLLTESVILSFSGAALGIVIAFWATKLAMQSLFMTFDLTPDIRVLLYLVGLAISTGVLFGTAPALLGTDLHLNQSLKRTRVGSDRWRAFSLGSGLVATQVALSAILLIGALLFARTLQNLRTQPAGLERQNLGFIPLDTERTGMDGAQMGRFYDGLLDELRRLPSVRSASVGAIVPFTGSFVYEDLDAALWPKLSKEQRMLYVNRVAPLYFQTLGLPLLQGRDFDRHDAASKEKVAILNAFAARTYFPNTNAVGQFLKISKDRYRIIGVVGDAKYTALRDAAPRTVFQPAMESNGISNNPLMAGTTWNIFVRATSDFGPVLAAVRSYVRSSKRDVTIGGATPFDELINGSLLMERVLAILTGFFAALAAALVAIGIYGVLGYTVTRRTSEIGVRLALGATARDVLQMILTQAVTVTAVGVLIGVGAGLAAGRFVSAMLFGVRPSDPLMIITAALFMLLLGVLAGFLPARRASKLDPMTALRYD